MANEAWSSRQTRTAESRRRYEEERLILRTTEVVAEAMKEAGLTRATLAEVLNTSQGNVTQLLSGSHDMTLRSLAALAHACGKRAEVHLDLNLKTGPSDTPGTSDCESPGAATTCRAAATDNEIDER